MKAKSRHWAGWIVILAVILLLAACGPDGAPPAPSPTATPRLAAVLPTRVPPTQGPSPTPLPSATPTVTDTPMPSDTPTETPIPTDTPTPTATATPRPSADSEPLTIVLTWATTGNVDLGVLEPGGAFVSRALPQSPAGGALSADANGTCDIAVTDVEERVTWPVGAAQSGDYAVFARYQAACGNEAPLEVTISVLLGDQAALLEDTAVLEVGQQYEITFAFDRFETDVLASAVGQNPSAPRPIRYGEGVTGVISAAGFEAFYTFDGRQGDLITVTMRRGSDDLDTYLSLLDAAGSEVAVNDDAAFVDVSTDSQIEQFALPADGSYAIVATRYQGATGLTEGGYTLTLDLVISGAAAEQTLGTLVYGGSTRGMITADRAEVRYSFPGGADDVVVIDMRRITGDLDPHLTLLGPGGVQLGANEDNPSGETATDARLDRFLLPGTGTYTILAGRSPVAPGPIGGVFEIALELFSTDPVDALLFAPQALVYGDAVTGDINDRRYERLYTFEGEQGDPVTIELSQIDGDLDSFLMLQDASGNQLAFNDDATGAETDTDSRIANFRLPATGVYTIVATRFRGAEGTSSGSFELRLTMAVLENTRQIPVTLEAQHSGSVSDGGSTFRQVFPGDDARNGSYQAFLSFALPQAVTADSLVAASLLLGECTLNGDPFEDLGSLGVWVDAYGTLEAADFAEPDSPVQVGAATACPSAPLDVTQVALTTLQNGELRLQFRLVFPLGSDDDNAIDDVTFTAPQLVLEMRIP